METFPNDVRGAEQDGGDAEKLAEKGMHLGE
jgi:hypothetical protein